jgi:transposase
MVMNARIFAKGNIRTINNLKILRSEAQSEKAPRVVQRIQGVMLSLEKYSINEIARFLHVQRSTVHNWITAWNEFGKIAFLEGYRSGRPPRLANDDHEKLADIIESGPLAYGLETGVWTSPIIRYVIENEFNIQYHPGHIRKLIKQLGFSVQRPTTALIRADTKSQNRWIRYTYPNLKKKHAKKMH